MAEVNTIFYIFRFTPRQPFRPCCNVLSSMVALTSKHVTAEIFRTDVEKSLTPSEPEAVEYNKHFLALEQSSSEFHKSRSVYSIYKK